MERRFLLYVLRSNFLVQFEPSDVASVVLVLQTEEPNLSDAKRLHYLK